MSGNWRTQNQYCRWELHDLYTSLVLVTSSERLIQNTPDKKQWKQKHLRYLIEYINGWLSSTIFFKRAYKESCD